MMVTISYLFEGCPEELLQLLSDDAMNIDNSGCVDMIGSPPNGIPSPNLESLAPGWK